MNEESDDKGREEDGEERDLEEVLDRERHGSGEFDPEERYGRRDVYPDREREEPGDESSEKPDDQTG